MNPLCIYIQEENVTHILCRLTKKKFVHFR